MSRDPAAISPAKKLRLLRQLDVFHPWESLEEKRFCRRCGETFSGSEISVVGAQHGTSYRLECPTKGCPSVPIEWIIVSSETPVSHPSQASAGDGSKPVPVWHRPYRRRLFGFLRVSDKILLW